MSESVKAILKGLYVIEEINRRVTKFVKKVERKVRRYSFIFLLNVLVSFLGILYFTQGLILWIQRITHIKAEVVYMIFGLLLIFFAWLITRILLWQEKTRGN